MTHAHLWSEHRNELGVSDHCTIYSHEIGQLCIREQHWDCFLYHPIQFKDRAAAYKWIESGTIARLQEELGTLEVVWAKITYMSREKPEWTDVNSI